MRTETQRHNSARQGFVAIELFVAFAGGNVRIGDGYFQFISNSVDLKPWRASGSLSIRLWPLDFFLCFRKVRINHAS